MIKKIENYVCGEFDKRPTLEEIKECISIAKENDCIVRLEWYMEYSGRFFRYFDSSKNAEEEYNIIHKEIYGI